jgi:hypothetical protein
MQIRKMNDALKYDGIFATYAMQIDDGRIGTYAQRLAILSARGPTYAERIQTCKILPYNEATKE